METRRDWRTWWGKVVVKEGEGLKIMAQQLDVGINGFRGANSSVNMV